MNIIKETRVVTTTSVFGRGYPAQTALERLCAVGFDSLDMGLDYWTYGKDSPFMGDGYLDWAKALRERAEALGVRSTHAHGPGGADSGEVVTRAIKTAAVLGAKYIVLHPMYRYPDLREIADPEDFIRINAAALRPFLEEAERQGIVLLAENLQDGAVADPRVISALVEEVASPAYGWCYDSGHAHCCGFGPDLLAGCVPPLSVHFHDNDGAGDDHLIPGDGTIDWRETVKALLAAGYTGDCVLEAHHQCLHAPDEEREAILARLLESGRWLAELISN